MKCITSEDLETLISKTFIKINKTFVIEDQSLLTDIKTILLLKFNQFKKKEKTKLNKRDLSAYNLFMKENFQSDSLINNTDNLKQIELFKINAHLWKNLTKEKKQEYINKAKILKKKPDKTKKTKKRKLCGYNLYYKENIIQLKATQPENMNIMKHISNNWINLSSDEKNKWNIKANELIID